METRVYPHAWLHHSSRLFLKNAKASQDGRFHNLLASNLLIAFSFEAYLNYLGHEKIPDWNNRERKLRFREKLDIVANEIGYLVDHGKRPFQTVNALFEFRDEVAHAKPETVVGVVERMPDGTEQWPTSDWIKQAYSLDTTNRNFDDVTEAIQVLHEQAGYRGDPFLITQVSYFGMPPEAETD